MTNRKEYMKAWYQAHKELEKIKHKDWYIAHRDEHNATMKAYAKTDINALGQTKQNIRTKSQHILKKMNLHIDGYQIHHCFGYEDPAKFIYISKSLHLKIHQYLRDNNIKADSNHWMYIRDLVNNSKEFTYIKC